MEIFILCCYFIALKNIPTLSLTFYLNRKCLIVHFCIFWLLVKLTVRKLYVFIYLPFKILKLLSIKKKLYESCCFSFIYPSCLMDKVHCIRWIRWMDKVDCIKCTTCCFDTLIYCKITTKIMLVKIFVNSKFSNLCYTIFLRGICLNFSNIWAFPIIFIIDFFTLNTK